MPTFRLATLLMVVTAAGVLVWLNFVPSQRSQERLYAPIKTTGLRKIAMAEHRDHGWPVTHMRTTTYTDIPSAFEDDGRRLGLGDFVYVGTGNVVQLEFDERPEVSWAHAAFNFIVGVTLLLLTMIASEFLLSRVRPARLKPRFNSIGNSWGLPESGNTSSG